MQRARFRGFVLEVNEPITLTWSALNLGMKNLYLEPLCQSGSESDSWSLGLMTASVKRMKLCDSWVMWISYLPCPRVIEADSCTHVQCAPLETAENTQQTPSDPENVSATRSDGDCTDEITRKDKNLWFRIRSNLVKCARPHVIFHTDGLTDACNWICCLRKCWRLIAPSGKELKRAEKLAPSSSLNVK